MLPKKDATGLPGTFEALNFHSAVTELKPLLEGPEAVFKERAAEALAGLCRSIRADSAGALDLSEIDVFWSFLAQLVRLQLEVQQEELIEVIGTASASSLCCKRFWLLRGRRLPVGALASTSRPDIVEAAEAAAGRLLAWSPSSQEVDQWLAAAPKAFQAAAREKCEKPEGWQAPDGSPGVATSDASLGSADISPTAFGRGVDSMADTDASPSSESFALLGGSETKLRRKPLARMGSRLSSWAIGKTHDGTAEMEGAASTLQQESPALAMEEIKFEGHRKPSGSFVVAACRFVPDDARAVAPGDGVMVCANAGELFEVLGHHPAGWVRVRPSSSSDGLDGWLPEGVCKAAGEVGRAIASQAVDPKGGPSGKDLCVQEGALLKLLQCEGDKWWVEVDGCRGYVPSSAMREPRPGEEAGLSLLGKRLARALSSASVGQKGARRPAGQMAPSLQRAQAAGITAGKDADGKRASDGGTEKHNPWTFGLWAYMASFYAIMLCLLLGAAGVASFFRPLDRYPGRLKDFSTAGRHLWISVFSLSCGMLWFVFNQWSKLAARTNRYTPRGTPVRGVATLLLAVPLLSSGLTFLAGVATVFVALLFCISAKRREKGSAPDTPSATSQLLAGDEELRDRSRLMPGYWILWWELQGVRGERPKWLILFLWVVANAALGTYKYVATQRTLQNPTRQLVELISTQCWTGDLAAPGDEDCTVLLDLYQTWIPWAKFFGMTLNLNCALIILMVCQQFLVNLVNYANNSTGLAGQFFRKLPTHKNLIFHKGLAAVIAVQAFIHTFAHFMAHSWTLPTLVRMGTNGKWVTLSIWITGAAIIMCIVAMYPVSRDFVKRTKFEAFRYTHLICATIFMGSLLWHGPVFYLWAAGPIGLYLVDRYVRWQVSSMRPGRLLQVRYRPPVLQLTFDSPWCYHAGQYVWLCCPGVKNYEKHPFTISSAPETDLLCVAIKCWPGGWTEKLRDYLAGICETTGATSKGFVYNFQDVNWLTGQPINGITEAPNGTPLLLIDGPHAAPAMRYLEFGVVILAAAGIGLTPASSVLRSLLQYRWRNDANAKPHSIYFCWLCACAEVPAFEWFTDELSDSEVAAAANEAVHGHESNPPRNCELHLFVTRAPRADDPKAVKPPEPQPAKLYGRSAEAVGKVQRPYTGAELLDWMQHPATKTDDMENVLCQPQGSRPNEAGHTCVWNGRPDWNALFRHVAQRHQARGGKVGVFFCGAPAIGKDLRRCCNTHSDKDLRFLLMKESF